MVGSEGSYGKKSSRIESVIVGRVDSYDSPGGGIGDERGDEVRETTGGGGGFEHLQIPLNLAFALGVLELTCTAIYLLPRTAVAGGSSAHRISRRRGVDAR